MAVRYPSRELGDVLVPVADPVQVESTSEYRIAGVLGFGRGVFEREMILGAETKYGQLYRLQAGTLVYSKLKAFEGAIAVVDNERAGAFVSQEFPTFRPTDDLDVGYLAHLCRWPALWSTIAEQSKGVGARRERLHPDDLLSTMVPVPAIGEQRRIASHLDSVHAAVTLVGRHRSAVEPRSAALAASLASQPQLAELDRNSLGWDRLPLGEVMMPADDQIDVAIDGSYPNLGIYSFGRGVFEKPPIIGLATSAKKLNRVRAGEFIYSRLFAFEGAYAYVPDEFDGYFVSNEFPSFRVDPSVTSARFIAAALRSPDQWTELAGSSKGLGLRRQRIQAEALLAHEVWFPPLGEQQRIVAGLENLDRLTALLERSDLLVSAVGPSALNWAFAGLS